MDVEKAIQGLLEGHRRAMERADRADARMDKFEKQLNVTEKLARAGMKLVIERDKRFDFKLNALIDAQMRTDEQIRKQEEQMRKHHEQMRKHEEQMRKHEEQIRKSDEKFNRLLDQLRRNRGNGHN